MAPTKACVLNIAIVIATSLKNYATTDKVLILSKLASVQLRAGLFSEGTRSLNQALDAYKIVEPNKFASLATLIGVLTEAGRNNDVEDVLQTVDVIHKCSLMLSVYLVNNVNNDVDATKKVTDHCLESEKFISEDVRRASVLAEVANIQARAQLDKEAAANIERARQLAPLVPTFGDDQARASLLAMIMNTLEAEIILGRKEKARRFLDRALTIINSNQSFRTNSLRSLFQHDGVVATIIDVRPIANETTDEVLRSNILASGVIAHANNGQIAEADLLVKGIKDDSSYILALVSIVRAQKKMNMKDDAAVTAQKALKAARDLREPELTLDCLMRIADALPS